jgi:hypothetical protein
MFKYKIKDDAFGIMSNILRNPSVTGPEIDGQHCRITITHDLSLAVKPEHLKAYKDDELVQVRLKNNDSREFVVLKSLLKETE